MKLLYASDEVMKLVAADPTLTTTKAFEKFREDLQKDFPIGPYTLIAVTYDSKNDRYSGKFTDTRLTHTLKLTTEVAEFLLPNHSKSAAPYVYLAMKDGAVNDLALMWN